MRIDYNWYWIIWDDINKEWIFEWKSKEKKTECMGRITNEYV